MNSLTPQTFASNWFHNLTPIILIDILAYTLPPTVFMHIPLALGFLDCYSLVSPGPATFHQGWQLLGLAIPGVWWFFEGISNTATAQTFVNII